MTDNEPTEMGWQFQQAEKAREEARQRERDFDTIQNALASYGLDSDVQVTIPVNRLISWADHARQGAQFQPRDFLPFVPKPPRPHFAYDDHLAFALDAYLADNGKWAFKSDSLSGPKTHTFVPKADAIRLARLILTSYGEDVD